MKQQYECPGDKHFHQDVDRMRRRAQTTDFSMGILPFFSLYLMLLGTSFVAEAFLFTSLPSSQPTKHRDTNIFRATRSGSPPDKVQCRRGGGGGTKSGQNKKEDLDALLVNMGLTPATSKNATDHRRPKATTSSLGSKSPKNKKQKPATTRDKMSSNISLQTQLDYARNGHTVLRNFIDPMTLRCIRKTLQEHAKEQEFKAWQQKVQVASNSPKVAESCRTVADCRERLTSMGITASLPFLQYFNLWKTYPQVQELAYSLGHTASVLLDVPSIRLYQDALFWKRLDDGPTPWHVDARMAPFDTSHILTIWIPLHDVPLDGTALTFCSKSHTDFALPYWNPLNNDEWDRLEERYPKKLVDYMPMTLGDITVHSGWTLHSAKDNAKGDATTKDRMALAISFVDAQAELRPDVLDKLGGKGDNEDQWSYKDWVQDVTPRTRFQHNQVPIVWPRRQ